MTDRQLRIAVDLFTGLVVASVGVALAGLTWRLAGDAGNRFGAAPVAARSARAVDLAPLIALAPFGNSAPVATQAADQTLLLKGIIFASMPAASSALVSIGGAPPIAIAVGSQLGPGTVESIAADHLVIATTGGRQALAFPDPAAGTAPQPVAGSPPPAMITSSPVAAAQAAGQAAGGAAPDPATFLSSIAATPVAGGYRLGDGLAPPLRLSGLQPGDVIERINGTPVGDAARDRALLGSAWSTGVARLDVLRAGQRLTLTLSLR